MTRRKFSIALGLGAVVAASFTIPPVRRLLHPLAIVFRGQRTVQERVDAFGEARARVREQSRRAGLAYPPGRVVLLGLKDERILEVYAGAKEGAPLIRLARYTIEAASGSLGPKLREGDRQVPEGVYAIESLNPNSRFHVALRVGYPNAFAVGRPSGTAERRWAATS